MPGCRSTVEPKWFGGCAVATAAGVSAKTVAKWVKRFE
eukprot:gene37143-50106_t